MNIGKLVTYLVYILQAKNQYEIIKIESFQFTCQVDLHDIVCI